MEKTHLLGMDVQNDHGQAAAAAIPDWCTKRGCMRAIRYATYNAMDTLAEGESPDEAARRTIRMIGRVCATCSGM